MNTSVFIATAVISLSIAFGVAQSAWAHDSRPFVIAEPRIPEPPRGPEVPFPLSEQIAVPWKVIEGLWVAEDESLQTVYRIEAGPICQEKRAVHIHELDPSTGRTIASAVGILRESQMLIQSEMTGRDSEGVQRYQVLLRAFQDGDQSRLVLTIRSLETPARDFRHLVLRRVSDLSGAISVCP